MDNEKEEYQTDEVLEDTPSTLEEPLADVKKHDFPVVGLVIAVVIFALLVIAVWYYSAVRVQPTMTQEDQLDILRQLREQSGEPLPTEEQFDILRQLREQSGEPSVTQEEQFDILRQLREQSGR